MKTRWAAMVLFAGALLAPQSLAQIATTGEIDGKAMDQDGQLLAGVEVIATSPDLQGERATRTGPSGTFQLPNLPPGSYTLRFRFPGHAVLEIEDVWVLLGGISPVTGVLDDGDLVETVTVTAGFPMIQDKTSTVSYNFAERELEMLPSRPRTFVDVTKWVPSVAGMDFNTSNPFGREKFRPMPSIRGEGQYGDNYLIDGLSVRDPAEKDTGAPLNFDAIEEIQIVTDGFAPEYGQALGGSVNVITKSGANALAGEVAYQYRGPATTSDFDEVLIATPKEQTQAEPYVNVGGAFIKDRLWYFASYDRHDFSDDFNSTDLSGVNLTLPGGTEDRKEDWLFGKLTWSITPRQTLSGNYQFSDSGTDGIDANRAEASARRSQDRTDNRSRVNYQVLFNASSILEVKAGHLAVDRTIDPSSGQFGPAQYEITAFDALLNNAARQQIDDRTRDDFAAVYTHFFRSESRGSHELKVGFDYRELSQQNGDFYTGLDEDVFSIGQNPSGSDYGSADRFNDGATYSITQDDISGELVPETLREHLSGGLLENRNDEWGGFVQDRWEIGNWNVLAGFRVDAQSSYNDLGQKFFSYTPSNAFAPRLSVTWDVKGAGRNVLKAGWGRFYDATALSLGEFANSRGSSSWRTYTWAGGTDQYFRDHIDDASVYDIHNPANWSFSGEQSLEQTPYDYSPLKGPSDLTRFLLEYDRQVRTNYVFKARYVDGKTRGMVEDVHTNFLNFTVENTDAKRRDYKSLEFEFNGNPTPNVSFHSSWVHSTAKGTNPGQFESAGYGGSLGSGNNIGVYLDRPPSDPAFWCSAFDTHGIPWDAATCTPAVPAFGWTGPTNPMSDLNNDDVVDQYDFDLFWQNLWGGLGGLDGNDGWYGDLPYSVDDLIKVSGLFRAPRWWDMEFGVFGQWGSGYRTSRYGYQGFYGDYLSFSSVPIYTSVGACTSFADCTTVTTLPFEQQGTTRGSEETDPFWSVDFSAGKVWSVARDMSVEVRAEVFNVFDQQTVVAFQNQADPTTYGQPLSRQLPRTSRIVARFAF